MLRRSRQRPRQRFVLRRQPDQPIAIWLVDVHVHADARAEVVEHVGKKDEGRGRGGQDGRWGSGVSPGFEGLLWDQHVFLLELLLSSCLYRIIYISKGSMRMLFLGLRALESIEFASESLDFTRHHPRLYRSTIHFGHVYVQLQVFYPGCSNQPERHPIALSAGHYGLPPTLLLRLGHPSSSTPAEPQSKSEPEP